MSNIKYVTVLPEECDLWNGAFLVANDGEAFYQFTNKKHPN